MSDLDLFTTAELEQQAAEYYANLMAMLDAMPHAWQAAYPAARGAADEQSELLHAAHVELGRRFAANASIFHG